ncbi:hypothetical protein MAPG_10016 [Magnaporthiopsis poae ATCC 64411]|uniref:DNA-directed RNA polymerase subunit n=1 Tax=Magnaporthiopsis poae (strain ATCC 64411 / 73-15) TaxID=644358 RepID=A0A0C4EBG9_MAGP6|nr:hypothetical protein MAPG_10016 [Magnaporthiopsis poae ATCC 64411]
MAIQFCGDCGDTLPITADRNVRCDCCGKTNQNTLIGEVTITTWKNSTAPLLTQDKTLSSEANWASIEEDCRFCDATEVRYTTLQTRGADEGSTVFYFCPTCKKRYKENN